MEGRWWSLSFLPFSPTAVTAHDPHPPQVNSARAVAAGQQRSSAPPHVCVERAQRPIARRAIERLGKRDHSHQLHAMRALWM
eukprot:2700469-Pyramimonas_sp.AAC.1